MELEIRGRNLELNESARDYIGKKIDRLARHLPDITTATVDLSGVNARDQASRVVVQVTLNMDGTVPPGRRYGGHRHHRSGLSYEGDGPAGGAIQGGCL